MVLLDWNSRCRICHGKIHKIHFGESPIAGYRCSTLQESLTQPIFDLTLLFCPSCCATYMNYDEKSEKILHTLYEGHNGTYYNTKQMNMYDNSFVNTYTKQLHMNKNSTVLEIGCNNGNLLRLFRIKTHCKILGIEPSNTFIDIWKKMNIPVIKNYFTDIDISVLRKQGPYTCIYFRHVLEHILDPVLFFNHLVCLMDNNTRVVIEVPYIKTMIKKKRIDNISYSHLNYFSVKSINEIAKKFGMGIENIDFSERDGGSILFTLGLHIRTKNNMLDHITKKEIVSLVRGIDTIKQKIHTVLRRYKKDEVVGYGAGAKGQHLLHILNIDTYLSSIIDDTPGYVGKYIPGTALQIVNRKILTDKKIKLVVNLAPTHTEAIYTHIPKEVRFVNVI